LNAPRTVRATALFARVAVNCHWDPVFWALHARQLCAVTTITDNREFLFTERDAFRRWTLLYATTSHVTNVHWHHAA